MAIDWLAEWLEQLGAEAAGPDPDGPASVAHQVNSRLADILSATRYISNEAALESDPPLRALALRLATQLLPRVLLALGPKLASPIPQCMLELQVTLCHRLKGSGAAALLPALAPLLSALTQLAAPQGALQSLTTQLASIFTLERLLNDSELSQQVRRDQPLSHFLITHHVAAITRCSAPLIARGREAFAAAAIAAATEAAWQPRRRPAGQGQGDVARRLNLERALAAAEEHGAKCLQCLQLALDLCGSGCPGCVANLAWPLEQAFAMQHHLYPACPQPPTSQAARLQHWLGMTSQLCHLLGSVAEASAAGSSGAATAGPPTGGVPARLSALLLRVLQQTLLHLSMLLRSVHSTWPGMVPAGSPFTDPKASSAASQTAGDLLRLASSLPRLQALAAGAAQQAQHGQQQLCSEQALLGMAHTLLGLLQHRHSGQPLHLQGVPPGAALMPAAYLLLPSYPAALPRPPPPSHPPSPSHPPPRPRPPPPPLPPATQMQGILSLAMQRAAPPNFVLPVPPPPPGPPPLPPPLPAASQLKANPMLQQALGREGDHPSSGSAGSTVSSAAVISAPAPGLEQQGSAGSAASLTGSFAAAAEDQPHGPELEGQECAGSSASTTGSAGAAAAASPHPVPAPETAGQHFSEDETAPEARAGHSEGSGCSTESAIPLCLPAPPSAPAAATATASTAAAEGPHSAGISKVPIAEERAAARALAFAEPLPEGRVGARAAAPPGSGSTSRLRVFSPPRPLRLLQPLQGPVGTMHAVALGGKVGSIPTPPPTSGGRPKQRQQAKGSGGGHRPGAPRAPVRPAQPQPATMPSWSKAAAFAQQAAQQGMRREH